MNFCSHCGSKIEHSYNVCPFCGSSLKDDLEPNTIEEPIPIQSSEPQIISSQTPPPYYSKPGQPQYYVKKESNTNGIVALVLGLLGCFVIPCVGSIIAIIFGTIGKQKDDNPSMAQAGLILGILGLCGWVILLFVIFLPIFTYMYVPYGY